MALGVIMKIKEAQSAMWAAYVDAIETNLARVREEILRVDFRAVVALGTITDIEDMDRKMSVLAQGLKSFKNALDHVGDVDNAESSYRIFKTRISSYLPDLVIDD
jgi:hypothetical protein